MFANCCCQKYPALCKTSEGFVFFFFLLYIYWNVAARFVLFQSGNRVFSYDVCCIWMTFWFRIFRYAKPISCCFSFFFITNCSHINILVNFCTITRVGYCWPFILPSVMQLRRITARSLVSIILSRLLSSFVRLSVSFLILQCHFNFSRRKIFLVE